MSFLGRSDVGAAMIRFLTVLFAGAVATSILGLAADVWAQSWPVKPIKIIESFPVGVGRDYHTRVIAEKLAAVIGQRVYIENRPGAAGRLAAQAALSAAPDGYTFIVMGLSDLAITRHLYGLPYDIDRDFVPISMTEKVPVALVVRASLSAESLAELIRYANDHPDELTFGSTGQVYSCTSTHCCSQNLRM
jgi:tripartite-type tricarboxylate transporter receptor subunit TctC